MVELNRRLYVNSTAKIAGGLSVHTLRTHSIPAGKASSPTTRIPSALETNRVDGSRSKRFAC